MLTNMTIEERERLAYAEGYPEAARLLARIADLEHAAVVLLNHLDMHAGDLGDEINGAIDDLREVLP
jgi:phosphoribosyl-ATP pyrophosphohydrolase